MDRAKRQDIPAGAVVMNRHEALNFIWEKVIHHEPVRDVFALKFGSTAAGGAASLSGLIMLQHFRKQLGLRKEAAISSNIACIFLPAMSAFLYHYLFVTPPILLQEKYCKVCHELKAVALQNAVGFAWPWGLAVVSASMTATKLGVVMPSLVQPIQLMKLSWHLANQAKGPVKFTGLIVCNTLGAVLLVKAEEAQVLTFKKRLQVRRVLDKD